MKNYKKRITIGNNEKHIVYYLHTTQNIPISMGWNSSEIAQIIDENRNLSIYVGFSL